MKPKIPQPHAKTEEELLYPAAILIGEYLNLRFGR